MNIEVSYKNLIAEYPTAVATIMKELRNSNSKHSKTKPEKLIWEFIYGHIVNFSHTDILNGHAKHNPNNFLEIQKRVEGWIRRIPHVTIRGNIGQWYGFYKLKEIPSIVKEHELQCAIAAAKKEIELLPLTKTEIATMVKQGLVLANK